MNFNKDYWNNLYDNRKTGWDIGYISTPIKEYFDQLNNKHLRILVPGAGNGYEPEYFFNNGFINTYYLDYSVKAVENFKKRCPHFPKKNILQSDFFSLNRPFDLIVESAFFTSFVPEKRKELAEKIYNLLVKGGKYVGVFFNHEFGKEFPPFGAIKENYLELVRTMFQIKTFETAYNSIKPRAGRELFFIFEKHN
jgi:thiopurine S-methyltransferase